MNKKSKVMLKKPADQSVKAFKEWVQALRFAMTGSRETDMTMTGEDWSKACTEFWTKLEKKNG